MSVVTMRRAGTVVMAAAAAVWADPSSLNGSGNDRAVRQIAAVAPADPPVAVMPARAATRPDGSAVRDEGVPQR